MLGMGADAGHEHALDVASVLTAPVGQWKTLKVTLDCMANAGVDMKNVGAAFSLSSDKPLAISYSSVKLASDEGDAVCPAK